MKNFKGLHIHFGTEKFSNWEKTYHYLITKSITNGLTYIPNRNEIEFNFGDKLMNPVFKIKELQLEKVQIDNLEEIYYSGFEIENNDSIRLQEAFVNKFNIALFTSKENRGKIVTDLLDSLQVKMDLATFGVIIIPKIRTKICQELIKEITKYYRVSILIFNDDDSEFKTVLHKIQEENYRYANKEILILTDTKTLESELIETIKRVRAINTKSKVVIYAIAKKTL